MCVARRAGHCAQPTRRQVDASVDPPLPSLHHDAFALARAGRPVGRFRIAARRRRTRRTDGRGADARRRDPQAAPQDQGAHVQDPHRQLAAAGGGLLGRGTDAGAARFRDRRLHAARSQAAQGAGQGHHRAARLQDRGARSGRAQGGRRSTSRSSARPCPGKLDLRAGGDGSAAGAEVAIDGVVRGTVPNTFELFAGHHQMEVRKAGYKTFSEWVDISEDEHRTRDLSLERAEAPTGSLLVTSDAGGDVYVDGTKRDTAPAIVNGLPAGDHIVEVRVVGVAALAAVGDGGRRPADQGRRHAGADRVGRLAAGHRQRHRRRGVRRRREPRARRRSTSATSGPASTSSRGARRSSGRRSRPSSSRAASRR